MAAGLSLSERRALRACYRERAIRAAERIGVTLRCQGLAGDMDNRNHQFCRGEERGGVGCLCRCHDNPGVAVLSGDEQEERA